jgi:hypothetical protein
MIKVMIRKYGTAAFDLQCSSLFPFTQFTMDSFQTDCSESRYLNPFQSEPKRANVYLFETRTSFPTLS